MSTKLKGPDGATHVQVDGSDYDVGEDGLFDIDNGEHVDELRAMGFLTEEETCHVCADLKARWPRVIHGMVQSGVDLCTTTSAEGILDIIESKLPMTPEQEEAEAGTIVGETVLEPEAPAEGGEGEGGPDAGDSGEGTDTNVNDQGDEQTDGEQGGEGDEGAGETGESGEGAPAAEDGEPAADAPAADDAGADAPVTDEAAPADGGPAPDAVEDPLAEVPKDDIGNPTFNKMNRAGIHAWLVANGGTDLTPGSAKDDLITAAEERADALIAAQKGE